MLNARNINTSIGFNIGVARPLRGNLQPVAQTFSPAPSRHLSPFQSMVSRQTTFIARKQLLLLDKFYKQELG